MKSCKNDYISSSKMEILNLGQIKAELNLNDALNFVLHILILWNKVQRKKDFFESNTFKILIFIEIFLVITISANNNNEKLNIYSEEFFIKFQRFFQIDENNEFIKIMDLRKSN